MTLLTICLHTLFFRKEITPVEQSMYKKKKKNKEEQELYLLISYQRGRGITDKCSQFITMAYRQR